MTALSDAAELCRDLDKRNVTYQVAIVRDTALMVSVSLPSERWEIEFFEDGHIELERFVSQGVNDAQDVHADLLAWLDD